MSRNICITAADGHTGFLIAELILTNNDFKSKVDSVAVLSLHPTSSRAKELAAMGMYLFYVSHTNINHPFQVPR
jgi:hypothetical protein